MIDVYKILYPTIAEYTFFSGGRGTFPKIDYILGHKINKLKIIRIIQNMLSDLDEIRQKSVGER